MNYLVYFIVALIAAGSVLLGLDFQAAPMSPMPVSRYELRAAVPPAPPAAETAQTAASQNPPKTEAAASAAVAKTPAAPAAPAPAPVAPVAAVAPPPASILADEPGSAATARPAPRCDLDACASAYRSFTPEDCTYQPLNGPRLLCTKGTPPALPAAAPAAVPNAAPEARAQVCNIAACSQSYPRSFSSADCTFQPSEGPRRVCTK